MNCLFARCTKIVLCWKVKWNKLFNNFQRHNIMSICKHGYSGLRFWRPENTALAITLTRLKPKELQNKPSDTNYRWKLFWCAKKLENQEPGVKSIGGPSTPLSPLPTPMSLKPRPHQQRSRSNIVECYKSNDSVDKVGNWFDIVAGVDGVNYRHNEDKRLCSNWRPWQSCTQVHQSLTVVGLLIRRSASWTTWPRRVQAVDSHRAKVPAFLRQASVKDCSESSSCVK